MASKYIHRLICPWCKKGEVLADRRAEICLSVRCPRCKRFFTADMDELTTQQAAPQRRELVNI